MLVASCCSGVTALLPRFWLAMVARWSGDAVMALSLLADRGGKRGCGAGSASM
jgi:hypothetical protein